MLQPVAALSCAAGRRYVPARAPRLRGGAALAPAALPGAASGEIHSQAKANAVVPDPSGRDFGRYTDGTAWSVRPVGLYLPVPH